MNSIQKLPGLIFEADTWVRASAISTCVTTTGDAIMVITAPGATRAWIRRQSSTVRSNYARSIRNHIAGEGTIWMNTPTIYDNCYAIAMICNVGANHWDRPLCWDLLIINENIVPSAVKTAACLGALISDASASASILNK